MDADKLMHLNPADILAQDNARFSLLRHQTDGLKASILAQGGVNTPVEVEPIPIHQQSKGGPRYRLTAGFYRHAAVTELNNADGAGLLLPAVVHMVGDDNQRLRRQVSENVDRKNLSPMDQAISVKKMIDAGVSKSDIRAIFARPGGRKGLAMQPASGAWLNMVVSFLALPKAMQEKIHDGRIGVAAAYELTKVAPEKRAAVLERAEAERQKGMDTEEKEEARILALESKAAGAEAKAQEKAAKVEAVKGELAAAALARVEALARHVAAVEAMQLAGNITVADFGKLDNTQKKVHAEKLGSAKADLRAAEKAVSQSTKDLDKAQRKANEATKTAEDREGEVTEAKAAKAAGEKVAPKGAAKKKEAVGPRDIKKAAAVEKAGKAAVLNAAEMREALKVVAKSKYPMVQDIAGVFTRCFNGEISTGTLTTQLEVLTGNRKTAKA